VVNDWNDKYSPSKPLLSPRKQKLFQQLESQMNAITLTDSEDDAPFPSPTTSPRKKKTQQSPTKKRTGEVASPSAADLRAQRKDFAAHKHAIAETFLAEVDNTVTNGRIAQLSASTGGIKLIWSKTLKTTAGRANWRREAIRLRMGPLPTDIQTTYLHHCSIELAEKVIDDEERLYNVLAHEYCHLTTFMISEIRNNPHGAEFKSWGAKVSKAFAHKGVEVTTKHSYKIEYKYIWECVTCGYAFKRHSKSVDPTRHSCGRCKGLLVQTKPTPRVAKTGTDGEKTKSEYQSFVKANFARVKREMGERGEDVQMGRVMEVVAREYRERKGTTAGKGGEVRVDEVESALEGLKL
jgi:predicted SprT family Zn-dependent metalloprotease